MAHEVVMPQLGLSMEAGRIAAWLKSSGDMVLPGESLVEVESDKANIEVEAVAGGVLQIVTPAGAQEIPVGTVIAYIYSEREAASASFSTVVTPADIPPVPEVSSVAGPVVDTPLAPDDVTPHPEPVPAASARRLPSSPAARRRARDMGLDWQLAVGTGPSGRIKERDVLRLAAEQASKSAATTPSATGVTISPLAQKLAERLGITVDFLAQRYPGRRIERDDVEAVVHELLQQRPAAQLVEAPQKPPAFVRRPLSGLRLVIAERMSASSHTAAPVTLNTEVDANELVHLRETLKQHTPSAPSYNALLAKITACALLDHPDLNATFENDAVVLWQSVHLGIAVDTPRGLVVPVIRHVEQRSLTALASEMQEKLQRAQAGKALPDELSGGTFTMTNLGAYGVDSCTPIINPPQVAILGVGRLIRKPVAVDDGSIAVRTMLGLSLTFDHRLIDGAPAARFLARIRQFIESPYLWLAHDHHTAHA